MIYVYTVEVECDTREQADQVMRERIEVEDDYYEDVRATRPFDYAINWRAA